MIGDGGPGHRVQRRIRHGRNEPHPDQRRSGVRHALHVQFRPDRPARGGRGHRRSVLRRGRGEAGQVPLPHPNPLRKAHPELDGAWYRAFDFRRWDYWASNADWEWGPWCTETGWTQPWIAGTLALRQQKTSLWDLVQKVDLRTPFDRLRTRMLPDDVLLDPEGDRK